MKHRMSQFFFIRKSKLNKDGSATIIVKITISGKSLEFSTGLSIQAIELWDSTLRRMRTKRTEAIEINDSLSIIEKKLDNIYSSLYKDNPHVTVKMVSDSFHGKDLKEYTLLDQFDKIIKQKKALSKTTITYLLRSAKRYAKLSGKELPVDCQEVNYSRLFETVRDNLLKERQQLDIIKKDGKLKFMISDDQASCLIYFIPCKVIDKVKGELRDIIISFFSIFQSCQNLEPLENNPILGYWRHDFEAPGACDRDWIKELRCYFKGRKKKRLDLIKEKSKYTLKELKNRIADYKTNSRKYKRLLELMAEGLDLFSKGKILSFEAEPYTDEEFYAEYYPVEMNRLIQIVYDTDDWFTENMIEWTNNEAGEQWYNYLSSEHFILSPQSKRIFRENEFLKSYLDWLVRFINVLL